MQLLTKIKSTIDNVILSIAKLEDWRFVDNLYFNSLNSKDNNNPESSTKVFYRLRNYIGKHIGENYDSDYFKNNVSAVKIIRSVKGDMIGEWPKIEHLIIITEDVYQFNQILWHTEVFIEAGITKTLTIPEAIQYLKELKYAHKLSYIERIKFKQILKINNHGNK